MHGLLTALSRHRPGAAIRYGTTAALLLAATALRVVASLDDAPFLLYLPLLFLAALVFGRGAGFAGLLLSDACAAWLFLGDDHGHRLAAGQMVALVQYLLVGGAMVAVCDALRGAIVDLEQARAELLRSGESLRAAKDEAEAAREAAESSDRAKSTFLANMSHELRTPLSAVIGYSEMLEEEVADRGEDAMLPDLGKIKSNAKHLLALINDVLDLSKIEANRMEVVPEDAALAPLLAEVAESVASLVRRRGNTLSLDLAPSLGDIRTDVVKLRQCLLNLLGNAAKFTENGRIVLGARREAAPGGDVVVLTVRDDGIGMTPAQTARLFERFTQADETTTRRFGGTGLGLALCRAYAGLLGGGIAVESEAGVGTCFSLRLPALLPAIPAAGGPDGAALPGAARPGAARDSHPVLVIDDEASQRELTIRFLERQGLPVRAAADGETGLALAREIAPRLILLDVMMPGMDGWSVLDALKADARTASVPVVMVSFVAEPATSAAHGAAGAVGKPVDWGRLRGLLDRFGDLEGDVLVVDDDADARARLRAALERDGRRVEEASDGAAALEAVRRARPRAVLLDLTMPVMDGFSFLRRLREMPGCAELPVIVLSARDVSGADRAALASADRVIGKGEISLAELAAELRRFDARS